MTIQQLRMKMMLRKIRIKYPKNNSFDKQQKIIYLSRRAIIFIALLIIFSTTYMHPLFSFSEDTTGESEENMQSLYKELKSRERNFFILANEIAKVKENIKEINEDKKRNQLEKKSDLSYDKINFRSFIEKILNGSAINNDITSLIAIIRKYDDAENIDFIRNHRNNDIQKFQTLKQRIISIIDSKISVHTENYKRYLSLDINEETANLIGQNLSNFSKIINRNQKSIDDIKNKIDLREIDLDEIYNIIKKNRSIITTIYVSDNLKESNSTKLYQDLNKQMSDYYKKENKDKTKDIDNRKEYYEIEDDNIKKNSEYVGAIFNEKQIKFDDDNDCAELTLSAFGKGHCEQVRFISEPEGAKGTCFIVGEDIIATAGHVYENNLKKDCLKYYCVFGYRAANIDDRYILIRKIPKKDIYQIKELFARGNSGSDWALLKLARKICDRKIPIISGNKIKDESDVYAIGHPNGLPVKFTSSVKISDNTKSNYFVANLDTFHGNSGSPIINKITNEIVGILVEGGTDKIYLSDPGMMCIGELICSQKGVIRGILSSYNCNGEKCIRSTEFFGEIPRN